MSIRRHKGSNLVGAMIAIQFDGTHMTTASFEGGAKGAANNANGKLVYTKILGTRVAMVTARMGTFARVMMYDSIVKVIGTKPADTKPLIVAILKANV